MGAFQLVDHSASSFRDHSDFDSELYVYSAVGSAAQLQQD